MAGVGLLLFNHVIAIDFIYCFLREFLQMNLFIEMLAGQREVTPSWDLLVLSVLFFSLSVV